MPGFKRPNKQAILDFNGTDYDGAEVQVNLSVPFEIYFQLDTLWNETTESDDAKAGLTAVTEFFLEHCLVDWNLEQEDGTPVEKTVAGVFSWPPEFVMLLLTSWRGAMTTPTRTDAPLAPPVLNGNNQAAEAELQLGDMSKPS